MDGKLVSVHTEPTLKPGVTQVLLGFKGPGEMIATEAIVLGKDYTPERVAEVLRAAAEDLDPKMVEEVPS